LKQLNRKSYGLEALLDYGWNANSWSSGRSPAYEGGNGNCPDAGRSQEKCAGKRRCQL